MSLITALQSRCPITELGRDPENCICTQRTAHAITFHSRSKNRQRISPFPSQKNNCEVNRAAQRFPCIFPIGFRSIGVPKLSPKMVSHFREWIHSLSLGEQPMVLPFVVLFREVRVLAESHLSISQGLVCGMVFGSSAALPFLWPLKLTRLYLL